MTPNDILNWLNSFKEKMSEDDYKKFLETPIETPFELELTGMCGNYLPSYYQAVIQQKDKRFD